MTVPQTVMAVPNPGKLHAGSMPALGSGRAILRHHTHDEVVWHPHDMSPVLMREILHMTSAGWALLATPGAGDMVPGALYHGAAAVAVCQDARIEETLRECLQVKTAGAVCDGPVSTLDEDLASRYLNADGESGSGPKC